MRGLAARGLTNTSAVKSPSWHRFGERFARRLGLESRELRLVALMGSLVVVLLCAYTIAKVVRDTLFLEEFGALSLPYAYIGVALATVAFVWLDRRLTGGLTPIGVSRFNQYAAIGFSMLAAIALPLQRHWTTAFFYVWTGSQAMMLLPHFWGLALDIWDSRRARRVFPFLAGCGLIGGLAGGGIAAGLVTILHRVGLMWVVTGLLMVSCALTASVERHRTRGSELRALAATGSNWAIFRRSSYIRVLTLALALAVIVGTLVDFQFKILIQRMYPDPHDLTRFLGAFFVGLNAVSLVFQFGAAGWLLQRLGLAASTGLQPVAILALASGAALTGGGWIVVAMRWVQGVVSQTLGKSSAEVYYAAIRPNERRRIKPAIDALVERWSDAFVGVLLLVVLRLFRVPFMAITVGTALLASAWLATIVALDRQYARTFRVILSLRWIEPDEAHESMRIPAARMALLEALRSDDERQVVAALRLCEPTRDPEIIRAVESCLRHTAPVVRTAAVGAMDGMGLPDREHLIDKILGEPHPDLRRAAMSYLLSRAPDRIDLARRLLDGDDPALRQCLLDALVDYPYEARSVITWSWIDARIESGAPDQLILAARGLGAMEDPETSPRLRKLLSNADIGVRRVVLESAARRPTLELLDAVLPLLRDSELSYEAREAVAAVGDLAVPRLTHMLNDARDERSQATAAQTLARIASPLAAKHLTALARSVDPRLRHLGLQGLMRVRVRTGRAVLPRSRVHRLFLREVRDYRSCLAPMRALASSTVPAVRLLSESYRESAERALQRGVNALACWYDPKPLLGVLDRLQSREPNIAAPALEYLGHVLPSAVFESFAKTFEDRPVETPDGAREPEELAAWIRLAWESGDAWLRACAVRASRYAPSFDQRTFMTQDADPMVRAELEALSRGDRFSPEPRAC